MPRVGIVVGEVVDDENSRVVVPNVLFIQRIKNRV